MRQVKLKLAIVAAMATMLTLAAAPALADDWDGDCWDDWGWGWVCGDDFDDSWNNDWWTPSWWDSPVELDVDYEGDGSFDWDDCVLEEVDWNNDGFWELEYVCY